MVKTKEFLKLFDRIYMEKTYSVFLIFNRYLKPLLKKKDYDSFMTLYAAYLNAYVKRKLEQYCKEQSFGNLPEHLERKLGLELGAKVKEWQAQTLTEAKEYLAKLRTEVEAYFKDNHLQAPEGFFECFDIIGRTLISASLENDEAFERSWSVFSIMLCLAYKGRIEGIKEVYREEYYKAHAFIKKSGITLPYYYVLVWDIWKAGKDNDREEYKHNQERIRKNLGFLPELYRDLLSDKRYRPEKDRYADEESEEEKQGLKAAIHFLDHVHIDECLPSFSLGRDRPKYMNCKDSMRKDADKTWRNEFYHPYPMMMIPCTQLYRTDNMDIDSYINKIYWELQTQVYRDGLDKYETTVREQDRESQELRLNVSKKIKQEKADIIPEKELLLRKLEKGKKKVSDFLLEADAAPGFKKRFVEYGFARKTYYDLLKIKINSDYKSIPSKDTMIGLICAMELDVESAKQILSSCGYIFSPACEKDVIVEHMIANKHWNVKEINELLIAMNLKPITGRKRVEKNEKQQADKEE